LPALAPVISLPRGPGARWWEGGRRRRRAALYSCRLGLVFLARLAAARWFVPATSTAARNKLPPDPAPTRHMLWLSGLDLGGGDAGRGRCGGGDDLGLAFVSRTPPLQRRMPRRRCGASEMLYRGSPVLASSLACRRGGAGGWWLLLGAALFGCAGFLLCAGAKLARRCSQLKMQLLLPWLRFRSCSPFLSSLCDGDGGVACGARDDFPTDAPEPDSSSRPSGRAYMRYSKPLATAYADWSTLCVRHPSVPAKPERKGGMAKPRPSLKKVQCAIRSPEGRLCYFFIFWGCLCKVLGQLSWSAPERCMRVAVVLSLI
jgi:hypothetical protein